MHKKPRILVVDDNPEMLLVLTPFLQSSGYEVCEGMNGQDCLRLAREKRPELILLDVMLPDINGVEVCRQIKADPALKNIFVILISGHVTATRDRITGLDAGADEYIARPIAMEELLARLHAMSRIQEAIEARRQVEEQVLQLNLTLEKRVAKRTRELEQINEALTCEIAVRKRAEQRLSMERAVSRILAEDATVGEAVHKILEATCEILNWDRGELWAVNQKENEMRCGEIWQAVNMEFPAFDALHVRV